MGVISEQRFFSYKQILDSMLESEFTVR
jgi:hypothetical protein